MNELICVVLYIVLFILVVFWCAKKYFSASDFFEKTFYALFPIIYFVMGIIYIFDSYNIPSNLNWDKNVSIERWFNYISNYSSSIVGAIIGGVFVVFITKKQIDAQNRNYQNDKRLQNAPLFKYTISNEKFEVSNDFCLYNADSKCFNYNLFFIIENIGLNHARDIYISISGEDMPVEFEYKIDKFQSILKKNESVTFRLNFNYAYKKNNNTKAIKIIVKYRDMLENNYTQEIEIKGIPTNKYASKYEGYQFNILSCKINDELFVENRVGD